jgi:hypothetical protein
MSPIRISGMPLFIKTYTRKIKIVCVLQMDIYGKNFYLDCQREIMRMGKIKTKPFVTLKDFSEHGYLLVYDGSSFRHEITNKDVYDAYTLKRHKELLDSFEKRRKDGEL